MGIEIILILVLLILAISGFLYFITKVWDWISNKKKERFSDQRAEFTYDLKKLGMKWDKRGKYEFAQALELVVKAIHVDDIPDTPYGREIRDKYLREQRSERD